MTDPTAARDDAAERSATQRQHAPADVAPELYGAADDPAAEPR